MDKVKTATGKEYECDYISSIPMPQRAYIRILNTHIAEVAAVFSDKDETAMIKYGEYELSGYTRLIAIIPENDAVKVALAKE